MANVLLCQCQEITLFEVGMEENRKHFVLPLVVQALLGKLPQYRTLLCIRQHAES